MSGDLLDCAAWGQGLWRDAAWLSTERDFHGLPLVKSAASMYFTQSAIFDNPNQKCYQSQNFINELPK